MAEALSGSPEDNAFTARRRVAFLPEGEDLRICDALGPASQASCVIHLGITSDPTASLMRSMAQQGWRTFCVSPSLRDQCHGNAADSAFLHALPSGKNGVVLYHEFSQPELCTSSQERRDDLRSQGWTVQSGLVASVRLQDIFAAGPCQGTPRKVVILGAGVCDKGLIAELISQRDELFCVILTATDGRSPEYITDLLSTHGLSACETVGAFHLVPIGTGTLALNPASTSPSDVLSSGQARIAKLIAARRLSHSIRKPSKRDGAAERAEEPSIDRLLSRLVDAHQRELLTLLDNAALSTFESDAASSAFKPKVVTDAQAFDSFGGIDDITSQLR